MVIKKNYLPLILSSTVEFNSSNLSISEGINSSLDSSLVQVETSTRNCKRILSSSDMVVAELMACEAKADEELLPLRFLKRLRDSSVFCTEVKTSLTAFK